MTWSHPLQRLRLHRLMGASTMARYQKDGKDNKG